MMYGVKQWGQGPRKEHRRPVECWCLQDQALGPETGETLAELPEYGGTQIPVGWLVLCAAVLRAVPC